MDTPNVPDAMPILSYGGHDNPTKGACIMEMASFLAGEKWSDRPECVATSLVDLMQRVNDLLDHEKRQQLMPMLTKVMGTNVTPERDLDMARRLFRMVVAETVDLLFDARGSRNTAKDSLLSVLNKVDQLVHVSREPRTAHDMHAAIMRAQEASTQVAMNDSWFDKSFRVEIVSMLTCEINRVIGIEGYQDDKVMAAYYSRAMGGIMGSQLSQDDLLQVLPRVIERARNIAGLVEAAPTLTGAQRQKLFDALAV